MTEEYDDLTDPDVEEILHFHTFEPTGFVVADGNKEIVSIGKDGKVTLGEGLEVDEAAQLFWDTVEKIAMADRGTCPHCGKRVG